MDTKKTITGEFRPVEREKPQKAETPIFPEGLKRKFLKDAAIAAALALGLWGISAIGTGVPGRTARETVSSELIADEDLGKLKFVSSEPPVDGEVVTTFSESAKQVEISADASAQVKSVLSGTVAEVFSNGLTVQNDNGTRSIYTGVNAEVEAGDYVEKGCLLGTLSGETLSLETVSAIGYIDSLDEKALSEVMD